MKFPDGRMGCGSIIGRQTCVISSPKDALPNNACWGVDTGKYFVTPTPSLDLTTPKVLRSVIPKAVTRTIGELH